MTLTQDRREVHPARSGTERERMKRWGCAVLLWLVCGCSGSVGLRDSGEFRRLAIPTPEPAAAVPRAAADSILTIGANVRGIDLLGWLAIHGYVSEYPFTKLFDNPPMTGPQAGVDSSAYVEFFRAMCVNQVVAYPDSLDRFRIRFADWPADSQDAFVRREWRCGVFNQCVPVDAACVCDGTVWKF